MARFLFRCVGLCTALATLTTGCEALRQAPQGADGPGYVAMPDEPEEETPSNLTISFEPSQLQIDPGESRPLVIQVTPAGRYEVRLALVGAGTAFLNHERVTSDADGTATVVLTVPSEDPELGLIVSVEGNTTELAVEVGPAIASVVVEPVYMGARPVEEWVVEVLADGRACPDATKYEAAGRVFPVGTEIVFEDVPATKPVHVFARGGQYVFGCVPNVTLRPGFSNEVTLPVTDRPVQLSGLDMALELRVARTAELEGALGTIVARMAEAFRAELPSDTDALLSAMAAVYEVRAGSDGRAAFEAAAEDRGWQRVLDDHLAERSDTENPVSSAVQGWLSSGSAQLFAEPGFFRGKVATSDDDGVLAAHVTLEALGPIQPRDAEIPSTLSATLNVTADDNVSVGFEVPLRPSRLFAELAEWAASEEGASAIPVALNDLIDCPALAAELLARSPNQSEPLPQCTPICLSQLCNDGLSFMWSQAKQSSASETKLNVLALGPAQIDLQARPLEFAGNWAGSGLGLIAETEVHLNGTFTAAPAE